MKPNFGTAMVLGVALCGFTAQLRSQGQSLTPSKDKNTSPRASSGTGSVQTAFVELPAVEAPESGAAKPVNDSTSSTATSSTTSAKTNAGAPESSTTSATPTTIPTALKNEAILKELAEVKKQFVQMQDEMKARIT